MVRLLLCTALLFSFCALTGCKESAGGGVVPKIKDKDGETNMKKSTPKGGPGAGNKNGPAPE